MDEAKDSVPTLQLSKQEILTGYSVDVHGTLLRHSSTSPLIATC